jgi:hypothetical protein
MNENELEQELEQQHSGIAEWGVDANVVVRTIANVTRTLADSLMEIVAAAGRLTPIIAIVSIVMTFAGVGGGLLAFVGLMLAELAVVYLTHTYRHKPLNMVGTVLYYTLIVLAGLNIGTAVAIRIGSESATISQYIDVLHMVPVITSGMALIGYYALPSLTLAHRARHYVAGFEAEEIRLEGSIAQDKLENAQQLAAIQHGARRTAIQTKAEAEKMRARHQHQLELTRQQLQKETAEMRIKAEREAHKNALQNPAVLTLLEQAATLEILNQLRRDTGISPNSKIWKELQARVMSGGVDDLVNELPLESVEIDPHLKSRNGAAR